MAGCCRARLLLLAAAILRGNQSHKAIRARKGTYLLLNVVLPAASTASKMTQQQLATNIKSVTDLPGRKVETAEQYVARLHKYGIDSDGVPW